MVENLEIGPSQVTIVAPGNPKKKLLKHITVKVRMDAIDLLELDNILKKEGFAERATIIRKLIHDYRKIALGNEIVLKYGQMLKSKREFNDLVGGKHE